MKTIEIQVFDFDELSDDAKETAIENYRNEIQHFDYSWNEEIRLLFDEIGTYFDCKWESFDIANNDINVRYSFREDIAEMSGIRALKWLENNFFPLVEKPKYREHLEGKRQQWPYKYRRYGSGINGFYTAIYSTIFKQICCPFTGICFDDDFIQPFIEFRKKPNDTTIKELFESGFYSVMQSANADYEYTFTDEAIIETIRCNSYQFTKNGKIWN